MQDDNWHACARIVEAGDPERFAAAMAAPVQARAVLFPIYAFNVEVSRAPWVTQEPMIAEMRLQWWRDALAEIEAGGLVRRHEVVTPLAMVLDKASAKQLDDLVLARRWDIYRDPFEDAAAFHAFLENTGGLLTVAAARALGAPCDQAAMDAGYAAGLAAYLQAVPALEAAGRVPLVDGRAEAVADLARTGLERLEKARRAGVPVKARPAFLSAARAGAVLQLAARDPMAVAEDRLQVSEFKRRFALTKAAMTGRF
ncbi:squalene/phytoene synthase family protein [Pseudoprimorskyibacter insulae]|uniref:Phytoene synthase n=1 Tax=Pseudoprimorskyibacter insulae TaxID=1695997 RepID=A0A2R8AVV3_9RHOB|nr:squalene/phytoene synthase family protein [Pseudoprimorskyibacter insulae]SPF80158.1 hypothetical protein PRI8871_01964 [Pseudoprimorskyibacter insulae]